MKVLNDKKEAMKYRKNVEKSDALELLEKMKEMEVTFSIKAGENGRVFGSVTSKDIAEQLLKKYKVNIDKKKILMQEQIKMIGITNVDIKLYEGVIAKLKVVVNQE